MISRIELTNFMSHSHTVIEPAAGLTVLVGPNNCGKSAVVAALQILCTNENSTYVLRHGSQECSVKIETDDGHLIEWRRKKSPSYVIDGQTFEKLRVSGFPDELHAALRLPKVDAGDTIDFDVHFGAQKSPIFLLSGSPATAARFFASSSDANRLLAMQKRHKDKLATAQRDKNRLEIESKQVNAALGILEPVTGIETRLVAARTAYIDLQKLAELALAAEKVEVALCIRLARVQTCFVQAELLRSTSPPPAMSPVEPLQNLIEEIVSAEAQLLAASARADALASLPQLPTVAQTGPLQTLVQATETEEKQRAAAESRAGVLSTIQTPPELRDTAILHRFTADMVRFARHQERAKWESKTLCRITAPPPLDNVDSLCHAAERLTKCVREHSVWAYTATLLGAVREPPRLADESELAETLAAVTTAAKRATRWEEISFIIAVEPFPDMADAGEISGLISRSEECVRNVAMSELALQAAAHGVMEAEADLRESVDGKLCPICGTSLDADRVIARSAIALERTSMAEDEYLGLLAIGDPHLEGRQPGFRKDDYPNVILEKLAWCLDYAIDNRLLPMILGDLFDKPRDNPNWMVGRLIDLFYKPREIIGLYGNHDVYNVPDLTEHDSFSLLVKSGRIRLVSAESPWVGTIGGRAVVVGGSSHRQPIPNCFSTPEANTADGLALAIWLTHHDINIPGYDEGYTKPFPIDGVQLLINGHIHRRLESVRAGQTLWVTPGNISRRARSDASREHIPAALRIDITPDDYKLVHIEVPHRPYEEVFYEAAITDIGETGQSAFVAGLAELQARRTAAGAGLMEFLEQNLSQFDAPVAKEIMNLAKEVTENVQGKNGN